ncbi:MAG TPA: aromatic-ring-hydroxylating dioxygenase subunit beta [Trebonia sp.]|jgi:p-cumate 2,3-dioxygenase beta subunit|nr:aromatic-ring-hydroxylating dioxygenase subunit beta [Trebonia sp.]
MTEVDAEAGAPDKLPVIGDVLPSLAGRDALMTRLECERFLFDEAALLDTWALDAWFELFAVDGTYIVPSTDAIYSDPDWDLALINEDKSRLAGRVQRLKSTWAHIENPHSRTSRLISNVRILADDGNEVSLTAAFVTYRSRPLQTTVYSGTAAYRLRRTGDSFLIVSKTVRLVHETLRDSGGVLSILL